MKKLLIGLFAVLVCLSTVGCGDNKDTSSSKNGTLTCTKEETDDDGLKTTELMEITYKNKKVTNVKATSTAEVDPEYIDMTLSFGELFAQAFEEIDGMSAEFTKDGDNKVKTVMEVDFTKLDPDAIKEALGDSFSGEDSEMFTKTDITIDEFKEENLEGYTCK